MRYETVIISDLHLGARNSRTAEVIQFLESLSADRIIVNGDLFDRPDLRGMSDEHYRVLEALRRQGRRRRVDWVLGNHDPTAEWFGEVLQVEAVEETTVETDDGAYLVCHGHIFDHSLKLPRLIVAGADAVYRFAQRVDASHRLAKRLKHGSKAFCRVVETVRQEALALAANRGFAGVILGHTHLSEDFRRDGVHYVNGGCWTERPSGFVGISKGRVRRGHWLVSEMDRLEDGYRSLLVAGQGTMSPVASLRGLRWSRQSTTSGAA